MLTALTLAAALTGQFTPAERLLLPPSPFNQRPQQLGPRISFPTPLQVVVEPAHWDFEPIQPVRTAHAADAMPTFDIDPRAVRGLKPPAKTNTVHRDRTDTLAYRRYGAAGPPRGGR